ncbi:65-kDa microtubule-associated protein 5 [Populus alba]|uniref:65-kDa microtubule-associated protein 5 n=1 Tax=Populus alba TaxID=43335 RepID=UPI00158C4289|nr:65-kDa microtubule-associated protein 5-like [Populus alba]
MTVMPPPPPTVSPPSTTCASLLHELQIIRDEIGESDGERDKILCSLSMNTLINPGRGTLKQQISAVNTVLDELRLKKQERIKVFYEKQSQIAQICAEIVGNDR